MSVRSLFVLLLILGFGAFGSAAGQVTVLVQIEGVQGSSTLVGYEGAIQASGFAWGASNTASPATGSGTGAGRAQFSEIKFTKATDSASPLLLDALVTGRIIPTASIKYVITSADRPQELSSMQLEDVVVVNQELSVSTGTPVESIALRFRRIQWEVCSLDATGARSGCNTVSWDISKNSP